MIEISYNCISLYGKIRFIAMSKLPKAPLIEVIFEIRWNASGNEELLRTQYLHGDLFSEIKDKYPHRESIQSIPIDIFINNVPTHRFRVAPKGYPLVQVGPGILTVNTIDSKYDWTEYQKSILEVVSKFLDVYKFSENQELTLVLQYIDLLKFDFEKEDVYQFLEKDLNIVVKQEFYKSSLFSNNVLLGLTYETNLGLLNIVISRGKNEEIGEGILIQTSLNKKIPTNPESIKIWLETAHEFCSTTFKEMTRGRLYESFKGNKK